MSIHLYFQVRSMLFSFQRILHYRNSDNFTLIKLLMLLCTFERLVQLHIIRGKAGANKAEEICPKIGSTSLSEQK